MEIIKEIAPAIFKDIRPIIVKWMCDNSDKSLNINMDPHHITIKHGSFILTFKNIKTGATEINIQNWLSTLFMPWFFIYSDEKIDPYIGDCYTILFGTSKKYFSISDIDQYYNYMLKIINHCRTVKMDNLPGVKELLIKIVNKNIPIYGFADNLDPLDADINREIWQYKKAQLAEVWAKYQKYCDEQKIYIKKQREERRSGKISNIQLFDSTDIHTMIIENLPILCKKNMAQNWDIQHRYTCINVYPDVIDNTAKYIERYENNSDVGFKYCATMEDFKAGDGARFYLDKAHNQIFLALY